MSWVTEPAKIETTYGKRLRQYRTRESTIVWVGAGLAGLIGLLASNSSADAPRALTAAVVTLIILGGGALAQARISFQWAATKLDRAIQDGAPGTWQQQLPQGKERNWPVGAEVAWNLGRLLVVVAAILYGVAVWSSAERTETSNTSRLSAPAAFLWFNQTWGRDDLEAFEQEAFRRGHTRSSLHDLYLRHVTVRHVLGIAR